MHDSSHSWTCCTGPVAPSPRVSREPRSQPSAAWNHPRAAQGALPEPARPLGQLVEDPGHHGLACRGNAAPARSSRPAHLAPGPGGAAARGVAMSVAASTRAASSSCSRTQPSRTASKPTSSRRAGRMALASAVHTLAGSSVSGRASAPARSTRSTAGRSGWTTTQRIRLRHSESSMGGRGIGGQAWPGRRSRRRRSWALRATTMVDALIRIAPTAGARVTPAQARAPPATGTATRL